MRRFTRIRLNVIVVTAATLVFAGSAQAVSCEELRSSVEAKILGKGVKNFSVTVVEAGTAWPGQVVGSCELGSKKLVYAQRGHQGTGSVQAIQPRLSSSPAKAQVITECADGRVVTQGSCKR